MSAAFSQIGSDGTLSLVNLAGVYGDFYLGSYLTATTNDKTNVDTTDFTLSANTSVGALNYMLVYIYIQRDDYNEANAYNTLQGYLTYSF